MVVINPRMHLKKVDLPAPFGPRIPIAPCGIWTSTSSRARCGPYILRKSRVSMTNPSLNKSTPADDSLGESAECERLNHLNESPSQLQLHRRITSMPHREP